MKFSKTARLCPVRTTTFVALTTSVVSFLSVLSAPLFARAVKAGEQPQDIRVTNEAFSYEVGRNGGRRGYVFSELRYVESQDRMVCFVQGASGSAPQIDSSPTIKDALGFIVNGLNDALDIGNKGSNCLPLYWTHKEIAAQFASAVNRMIWENSAEVKAQREQQFEQKAAAWRAGGSKVEVPEEAQRHLVIAQEAYQEKNSQHMAEELSAALDVYPTWPDQQRNLAILLGELNRYSEAIQHMQMYLALAPDAADAQRVKQQIWIWQDKVQSAQQTTPPAPAPTQKSKGK